MIRNRETTHMKKRRMIMKKIRNKMCMLLVMCVLLTVCTAFGTIESEAKTTGKKKTTAWAKAYMSAIQNSQYTNRIKYQGAKAGLFYIDNDSIPELVISGKYEEDGLVIISYHKGKMRALELYRQGVEYIPRSGLILSETGTCYIYNTKVIKLNKGNFTTIGSGFEATANEIHGYYSEWNGMVYGEKTYYKKAMSMYRNRKGSKNLVYSCKYNYNGILKKLKSCK